MSFPLLGILECPDLVADACCATHERDCIFLSAWGRDTAVQEFLARLTLSPSEDGLDSIELGEGQHRVKFPNMDRYVKRTTRTLRQTRFGDMVHLWIYDERCTTPDRANLEAFVLLEDDDEVPTDDRLWPRVKDLSPLPLLEHWRDDVMTLLHAQQAVYRTPLCLGRLNAWRIKLDEAQLAASLSGMIRSQVLTTGDAGY